MSDTLSMSGFAGMAFGVGSALMGECGPPGYLPASWKGVPFVVEKVEDKFGRRGESYEYPLGERADFKDLGRKARRYKISGYLIGAAQVALTNLMVAAAESPEPGTLIHPLLGEQLVSCVELSVSAELKREARKTKLEFDFIEANPSLAPYTWGADISRIIGLGWAALLVGMQLVQHNWATGNLGGDDIQQLTTIKQSLARAMEPPTDEASYDISDMLQRRVDRDTTFYDFANTIAAATETVRRIHREQAVQRLETWNTTFTRTLAGQELSPSVESAVLIARLALTRDLSFAVAETPFTTVRDALVHLDFVLKLFDQEEAIAQHRCLDELTIAIRAARTAAVRVILDRNVRLPGVVENDVQGLWPSVIAAHKLYGDATRYRDVENYNANMNPMFMGHRLIAPAA